MVIWYDDDDMMMMMIDDDDDDEYPWKNLMTVWRSLVELDDGLKMAWIVLCDGYPLHIR